MKIIGITGGIGAGKTTVCNMFKELGAETCDADEIAREKEKKGGAAYNEIKECFGPEIISENGDLNRKKLAGIVFSDKEKLEKLNKIVHKYVFEEIKEKIKSCSSDVLCLDVPLLFSSEFPIKCDYTVGVLAEREERIKRVEKRSGMSRDEIIKRIDNQISDDELLKKADFIVENNDVEKALDAVKKIMKIIRNE